eukprot:UN08353
MACMGRTDRLEMRKHDLQLLLPIAELKRCLRSVLFSLHQCKLRQNQTKTKVE